MFAWCFEVTDPNGLTLKFAASLEHGRHLLRGMAGHWSKEPITLWGNPTHSGTDGHEWRGEADTPECHAWIDGLRA